MLKQMKYEVSVENSCHGTAEAEAAFRMEVLVRWREGSEAMHSTKENCLPNYGFWRGSLLLGGYRANEVQSAYFWLHSPRSRKCKAFVFLIALVAGINHWKELQCGLSMEMLHKGNHLNNSPRFSPVDLYSLGREESGVSMLGLCSRGWSRALSGWMTTCQEEGRESEEWKEPCFRIQSSNPSTRTRSPTGMGWKTSNLSISWTSICGTFYEPSIVTHDAFRDAEKS